LNKQLFANGMRLRSAGLTIAANAAIAADPALLGVPRSSAIKTVSVLKFLFDSFYRVNVKKRHKIAINQSWHF